MERRSRDLRRVNGGGTRLGPGLREYDRYFSPIRRPPGERPEPGRERDRDLKFVLRHLYLYSRIFFLMVYFLMAF